MTGDVTYTQKQIVKAFARCDMDTPRTAKETMYSRQNVDYHLRMVQIKTGLNPRCFFDLVQLLILFGDNDMLKMGVEQ